MGKRKISGPVEFREGKSSETGKGKTTLGRVLFDDELYVIWRSLETIGYPYGRLMEFTLITGQPVEAVSMLRWSDIDLDACIWRANSKVKGAKKTQDIPLSNEALLTIERTPRVGTYVFSNDKAGRRVLTNLSRSKASLDRLIEADCSMLAEQGKISYKDFGPWRIDDLRLTARKILERYGTSPLVIAGALDCAVRDEIAFPDPVSYEKSCELALCVLGGHLKEAFKLQHQKVVLTDQVRSRHDDEVENGVPFAMMTEPPDYALADVYREQLAIRECSIQYSIDRDMLALALSADDQSKVFCAIQNSCVALAKLKIKAKRTAVVKFIVVAMVRKCAWIGMVPPKELVDLLLESSEAISYGRQDVDSFSKQVKAANVYGENFDASLSDVARESKIGRTTAYKYLNRVHHKDGPESADKKNRRIDFSLLVAALQPENRSAVVDAVEILLSSGTYFVSKQHLGASTPSNTNGGPSIWEEDGDIFFSMRGLKIDAEKFLAIQAERKSGPRPKKQAPKKKVSAVPT
tara:strand:- start:7086 stop:8648 length:1563 start_codon:yes stop_codon:yes gene_type:complete